MALTSTPVDFPLYEQLVKKQYEYNLNDVDVAEICHTIIDLDDQKHQNIIFLIIYHYYLLDTMKDNYTGNPHKMIIPPYGGKMIKNDNRIRYTIDSLPDQLKRLIYTYIYEITIIETK